MADSKLFRQVSGQCFVGAAVTSSGAPAESVLAGVDLLDGVARLPDGLVLIHSLPRFLSLEEETRLAEAMHAMA